MKAAKKAESDGDLDKFQFEFGAGSSLTSLRICIESGLLDTEKSNIKKTF